MNKTYGKYAIIVTYNFKVFFFSKIEILKIRQYWNANCFSFGGGLANCLNVIHLIVNCSMSVFKSIHIFFFLKAVCGGTHNPNTLEAI